MRPKKALSSCASCHEDVHRGQLAVNGNKDNCRTCHTTTSFADLVFDHNLQSRFPLTGKHEKTACAACHKTEHAGTATMVRYRPVPTACGSCHADTHQGQFLASAPRGRAARNCDFCHQTRSFKETTFDHNEPQFTSYALDGKHAAVVCARCHPTVRLTEEISTVRYRPLPHVCEDCHADFHHGEFRGFEP